MMRSLAVILLLWVTTVLQLALPDRMAIGTTRPDLLLALAGVLGLTLSARGALVGGFAAGAVQGLIIGANVAQYAVTRMAAAYICSRITDLELEIGPLLAGLCVALSTVLAQLLLLVLAPTRGVSIVGFLGDTILMALYNGVLALPLYIVVSAVTRQVHA